MSRDALVVGINSYQNFAPLTAPAMDAEAIAQVLEKHGRFTTVKRLPEIIDGQQATVASQTKVSRKQLRQAIQLLLNPPSSEQVPDTALLYFSGHGWKDPLSATEGYLASSDADPDDDYGVDFQWLKNQLEQSGVRQQIIWLDCCSSGTLLNFGELTSSKPGKARDRYFITSSRDFEESYQELESPYSVLTSALLEGLEPKNGDVTSGMLTYHLERQLKGQIQAFRCHSTSGSLLLTYGPITVSLYDEENSQKLSAKSIGEIQKCILMSKDKALEAEANKQWLLAEKMWTEILVMSPGEPQAIKALQRIAVNQHSLKESLATYTSFQ